jgi:hypothetical protein
VCGIVIVLATCIAGLLELELQRNLESVSRNCGELAVDIHVRRQAFVTVGTCHTGLATGQVLDGLYGPAPAPLPLIEADDLHRLRSHIPTFVITDVSAKIYDAASVRSIGAPFRCLQGTVAISLDTGPPPTYDWLLRVSALSQTILIPYRPLPGLASSWAFWAGLAYIGLTGMSFVRVHRRLRKGKCPRCAYVLAGLARCPECGTVVKSDGLEARPIGE